MATFRAMLAAVAVVLAGCIQSYHPFYIETAKTAVPELVGEWKPLKALDDLRDQNVKLWVCRETGAATYEVVTHGKNGAPATMVVVPFKVGGQLFCDVTAHDPWDHEEVNKYLATSVAPVHSLWKLSLTNNTVTLVNLDPDWLNSAVDRREISLPFITRQADERLYTATSRQWHEFLQTHGASTNAFHADPAYILKKRGVAKGG